MLTHFTGTCAVDVPDFVLSSLEILLIAPLGGSGPGLTASPVADPVLVSRVHQHLNISLVKDLCNLWHQVFHPIAEQESVHHSVALDPLAPADAKSFLHLIRVEE